MTKESNSDVMSALRKFYVDLRKNRMFPVELKKGSANDFQLFTDRIEKIIEEFKLHISRAKLLEKIISDRKELVCDNLFD
jgi:hypothetical protein